jgi:homoserine kinase
VLGVALSGAGPGVLLVLDAAASVQEVRARIQQAASDPNLEVLESRIAGGVRMQTA